MNARPLLALLLTSVVTAGLPASASASTGATGQVVAQVVRDGEVSFEVLDVARYGSLAATKRAAAKLPGVEIVTTPVTVRAFGTDGPERDRQWHLEALAADVLPSERTAAQDVVVAVLDTGVDPHPDFAPGTLLCDRGAEFSDPWEPDVSLGNGCADLNGHGTHVAGLISAARGNGVGVAGLSQAKILPVTVLDPTGGGSDAMLAAGIRHATDRGADIINMSLGSVFSSPLVQDAVAYAASKDVLLVAAAGNNREKGNQANYPAAYPSVVSVAAADPLGTSAPFSYAGPTVDIAAPGESVMSTFRRGRYMIMSGTSQAAPLVAATAAAYLAQHPTASAFQASAALASTARDVEASGRDDRTGAGVLDPSRLLTGQPRAGGPPPAPADLQSRLQDGRVLLGWRAVPRPQAAGSLGFAIYRDGKRITWGLYPSTNEYMGYLDLTAPKGMHTYRVTSFDAVGESVPTPEVSIEAPLEPEAPAGPPAPGPAPVPPSPVPALPLPPAPLDPPAPTVPPVAPALPTPGAPVATPPAAPPVPPKAAAPVLRVPAVALGRGQLVPVLARGLEPRTHVRVTAGWTERVRRVLKGKPVVQSVNRTAVLAALRTDRDGELDADVRGPQVVGPVRIVLEGVKPGGARARSQSTVTLR